MEDIEHLSKIQLFEKKKFLEEQQKYQKYLHKKEKQKHLKKELKEIHRQHLKDDLNFDYARESPMTVKEIKESSNLSMLEQNLDRAN